MALVFVLMFGWQLSRHLRGISCFGAAGLAAGLLLGLFNFSNIVFCVRAHQTLADYPAVACAATDNGVVVLAVVAIALISSSPLRPFSAKEAPVRR